MTTRCPAPPEAQLERARATLDRGRHGGAGSGSWAKWNRRIEMPSSAWALALGRQSKVMSAAKEDMVSGWRGRGGKAESRGGLEWLANVSMGMEDRWKEAWLVARRQKHSWMRVLVSEKAELQNPMADLSWNLAAASGPRASNGTASSIRFLFHDSSAHASLIMASRLKSTLKPPTGGERLDRA